MILVYIYVVTYKQTPYSLQTHFFFWMNWMNFNLIMSISMDRSLEVFRDSFHLLLFWGV